MEKLMRSSGKGTLIPNEETEDEERLFPIWVWHMELLQSKAFQNDE